MRKLQNASGLCVNEEFADYQNLDYRGGICSGKLKITPHPVPVTIKIPPNE